MKRIFISVIALLTLSGGFAQRSVDLELQGTEMVQVILNGPNSDCQKVALSLEVSYQPQEELIQIVMKGDNNNENNRITPNTKDQITHLFFPFTWNGHPYSQSNFKSHFKDAYLSSVSLETPIKDQTASNSSGTFQPVFEIRNGEEVDKSGQDLILSLKKGEKVLKIKVLDSDKPVEFTIHNLIPLRAKKVDLIMYNKYFLKYISNSSTITFNIPENKCARQYDLIQQYEELNEEISKESSRLEEGVQYLPRIEIVKKQWSLLVKYEKAHDRSKAAETECEELLQQFEAFNNNYDRIIRVNALTPDSLGKMIDSLDLFRELLQTANDRISCEEWKDEAVRYIAGVEIDEEEFDQSSKVYDLVVRFNKLKQYIEGFNCPVEVINTVEPVVPVVEEPVAAPKPATKKPKCKCSDAAAKFEIAANRIDDLIDKRRAKRVDNSSEFNSYVKQMDNYWNGLDESCKNDKQCKAKYEVYNKSKNNYSEYVK